MVVISAVFSHQSYKILLSIIGFGLLVIGKIKWEVKLKSISDEINASILHIRHIKKLIC